MKLFILCVVATIIIAIAGGYYMVQSPKHKCQDNTHATCDGNCSCDGMECRFDGAECPNVQHYLRDYQIELHMDTVWVYDADRLVGRYTNTKWDSQLDSILLKDNL